MTMPNTLSNEMLQGAQKDLIAMTFLQKSSSRDIQGSTVGTTTTPDLWQYSPSAGQLVHVTTLQVMLFDNTEWADIANFGDYSAALTSGCDFVVKYNGAAEISLINAANTQYWTHNSIPQSLYSQNWNGQLLYAFSTQDDRLLTFAFEFNKRQKIILNGDLSEYISLNVRQSLATPAIKILWATAGGYLI